MLVTAADEDETDAIKSIQTTSSTRGPGLADSNWSCTRSITTIQTT